MKPIYYIFLAIAVWGMFLSLGAAGMFGVMTHTSGWDFRKGAIVFGCVACFLGGWGILLATRRSQKPAPPR